MEKKQQLTSPAEAAAWLRARDNFLILTHRRPDGDTVGCAAALCRQLRAIGKTAAVLENPQLTAHFVPYLEGLTVPEAPADATLVAVDIASEGLFPMNGGQFAGKVALCIDHHESNEFYAETTIVWPNAAACGELMLEILQQLGDLDVPTAEALYLAISTDCGCFCYSNTTANTLRCAATLKDLGAKTYPINKTFFATKSMARMQVEALLASSLELMNNGRVGVCTLRQSDLDALGATEDDVDNIAGFARLVEGVELSVMIRDLPDGSGKVSLRSGEVYNSSAICKHLGGGGHRSAAGAEVPGGIEAARAAILAAIEAEGIQHIKSKGGPMPSGILIIDKPAGWTSHDVVAKLRGLLHEKRIGHGGTLDPMATGVLPVFVGRATRAVELFEAAEKEYVAGLRLGLTTTTEDTTGTVLTEAPVTVPPERVEAAVCALVGRRSQIPPMYSAVKIGGQKLYELARQGKRVERRPREIEIFEAEPLSGSGADYTFRVRCSKGTYVRTLCAELGETLGCGGCMASLRRTAAGPFTLADALPLAELVSLGPEEAAKRLRPIDSLFADIPEAHLCESDSKKCRNGAATPARGLAPGRYRVYGPTGEFLCLARCDGQALYTVKSFFEVN